MTDTVNHATAEDAIASFIYKYVPSVRTHVFRSGRRAPTFVLVYRCSDGKTIMNIMIDGGTTVRVLCMGEVVDLGDLADPGLFESILRTIRAKLKGDA